MDHRYWDSDCFIGWLQAEADKEALCKAVLLEARLGNITIITSALTIAEVLVMKGHPRIPSEKRTMVEKFFKNNYIIVRSVTRRISEQARELVWERGIYPKDAIHVATALDAKVPVMNTFDIPLMKKSGNIAGRQLIIERPAVVQSRFVPMFDADDEE